MRVTNNSSIDLSLAVWLLYDEYDYIDEPNYISVTRLMNPIRQIVLPARIPKENRTSDVEEYIARALGKSLHDSIEKAWLKGKDLSLALMGYPEAVRERVLVNPTAEQLAATKDPIPVYLEQRIIRDFEGYRIGGKYDMVTDGIVKDNKSTSAFSWLYGSRDDEHQLQMSLYRWIDAGEPTPKINHDYGEINYIFTDWSKMSARTNPNYPQRRVLSKPITLLSLDETENWVRNKIAQYERFKTTPEAQLPECTDEELWRSDPKYQYYSDPSKTDGRSTKNFDNLADANSFCIEKGKGIVITRPGEAKRCGYCPAFDACSQKDKYL